MWESRYIFKAMMSRTERIEWNKMTPEERDVWENSAEHEEKCSEKFYFMWIS